VKFDVLGSLKTTGQQAKQAMGQKWEYKIDSFYDKDLKTEMNVQGEAGWELVFARRALNEDEAMYEMIFKRRK